MVFEPSFSICSLIRARAPAPSAVVTTTAATPMRMPSIVSPVRSLLRTMATSARRSAERKAATLLVPQGFDGIEQRGAPGRPKSKEDSGAEARPQGEGERGGRQGHRPPQKARQRKDHRK